MNIGILGTGIVGTTLGKGFVGRGDKVRMGSREAGNEKAAAWAEEVGAEGSTGTFADAATFGEVVVLATGWSGTENALNLAGPANLAGKVVIDVTNPLAFGPGGAPGLALGHTDSGGEAVQRWLPDAKVVKAFNIVGSGLMVNPQLPGGPPDMFICGDDDGAKAEVTKILGDFGWAALDIGGIEGARLLEPMCILWVIHGVRSGTWNHAFKLLRS